MPAARMFQLIVILVGLGIALRISGGKLATKASLKPLLFLISRVPVLIAWGLGSAGMFWLIASEAGANGKDLSGNWTMLIGLCLFCGLGFAALVVGPLWAVSRIAAKVEEIPFAEDEPMLYEAMCNHFLGGEARGGRVFVTSKQLAFRPHRFNVQLDTWRIPLDQLSTAVSEGTRFVVLQCKGQETSEWLVVQQAFLFAKYLTQLRSIDQAERERANAALMQRVGLQRR